MIRNALVIAALVAVTFAAGATAQAGKGHLVGPLHNVTVIEKTDVFPILGPITVEPCGVEDCSDTK